MGPPQALAVAVVVPLEKEQTQLLPDGYNRAAENHRTEQAVRQA